MPADESYFFSLCRDLIEYMGDIVYLLTQHWYFALLFAAGLIGVAFDVLAALSEGKNRNDFD